MEPLVVDPEDKFLLSTDGPDQPELDSESIAVQVNLRLHIEEVANSEERRLRAGARRAPIAKELRKFANGIYEQRRLRDRVVGDRLFGEPAWDMLLALYCFPARGEMLTVSSLSYAAEVPLATGIRWQKVLGEQGLIESSPEGIDRRRKFVRLTSIGRAMMDRILTRLLDIELRPVVKTEIESVCAGSVRPA